MPIITYTSRLFTCAFTAALLLPALSASAGPAPAGHATPVQSAKQKPAGKTIAVSDGLRSPAGNLAAAGEAESVKTPQILPDPAQVLALPMERAPVTRKDLEALQARLAEVEKENQRLKVSGHVNGGGDVDKYSGYRDAKECVEKEEKKEKLCLDPKEYEKYRRDFAVASKALDKIAGDVEEYGSVTMSVPLLTSPIEKLEFGLKNDANVYYENAKNEVSGRALAATVILQSLSADLRGAADIDMIAAAKSVLGSTLQENENYQQLLALKQKRANLALENGLREADKAKSAEERAQKRQKALDDQATILKEDTKSARPDSLNNGANGMANVPNLAPNLPTNAGVINNTVNPPDTTGKTPEQIKADQDKAQAAADAGAPSRIDRRFAELAAKIDEIPFGQRDAAFPGAKNVAKGEGTAVAPEGADANKQRFNSRMALNDVEAVTIAEAAKSIQGLENFFHSPKEVENFRDKKVLMGAVTVSVEPGWRSKKDFAADISVRTSYQWFPARRETVERMVFDDKLPMKLRKRLAVDYQIEWWGSRTAEKIDLSDIPAEIRRTSGDDTLYPCVSGISPLSHSDTLDLSSEFKRQDEFALALAATLKGGGYNAQAKVFEQYVKSQRKDVQTRAASANVASYSNGGALVGFQVGPRLKALEDPASRKNKSANVLERQAFPALLVFGIDSGDIYPRLEPTKQGRLVAWEPQIAFTQMTHWNPLSYKYQGPFQWFSPIFQWPPYWQPAFTENKRTMRMLDTIEANQKLASHEACWPERIRNDLKDLHGNLLERNKQIKGLAYGVQATTGIPAQLCVPHSGVDKGPPAPLDRPVVEALAPSRIDLRKSAEAPAANQLAIAKEVSSYQDKQASLDLPKGEAKLLIDDGITKIIALRTTEKLVPFVKRRLEPIDKAGTRPEPTADQLEEDRAKLGEAFRYLKGIQIPLDQIVSNTTKLNNAVKGEALKQADIGTLPAMLTEEANELTAKRGATLTLDAAFIRRLLAESVDMEGAKTNAGRVSQELADLLTVTRRLSAQLSPSADIPDAIFAILGDNLEDLESVACALPHAVLERVQPSEVPGFGVTTFPQKRSILMRVHATKSTIVPFLLTFRQKSKEAGKPDVETTLYTPPLTINIEGAPTELPFGKPILDARPPAPVIPTEESDEQLAGDLPLPTDSRVAAKKRTRSQALEVNGDLFPLPSDQ